MIKIINDNDISIPYDSCDNTTVAILELNGVYIALCKNCLVDLVVEIRNILDEEE